MIPILVVWAASSALMFCMFFLIPNLDQKPTNGRQKTVHQNQFSRHTPREQNAAA